MYQWGGQKGQPWNAWSPQWPKNSNSRTRRSKEDKSKEKKEEPIAKPYDAAPKVSSSLPSSSGGSTMEAAFMKEFMEMVKEQKLEIPERLQRCLPSSTQEAKESLREKQKQLNKHRNVLNKLESKKKAVVADNEKWVSWINTMKQEIQTQKDKHEETQKRLSQEIEELEAEEKRLREKVDAEMEELEEPEEEEEDPMKQLDKLAAEARGGNEKNEVNEAETNAALAIMQKNMEERYLRQLEQDRQQMQQEMEKIMAEKMTTVINLEEMDEKMPLAAPKRDPLAPFGVQRSSKVPKISSPYGRNVKMEEINKQPKEQQEAKNGENG